MTIFLISDNYLTNLKSVFIKLQPCSPQLNNDLMPRYI